MTFDKELNNLNVLFLDFSFDLNSTCFEPNRGCNMFLGCYHQQYYHKTDELHQVKPAI